MKKRIISLALMSGLGLFIISSTHDVLSTGAPIGSSGAPGENTCAKSGCHTGADVNSGPGDLQVLFDGSSSLDKYEAGKTYTVTVRLEQTDIKRFGFQLLALNKEQKSSGVINITDNERMQVFEGYDMYEGRDYVTYKAAGTDPYAEGTGQWSFQWTAPEKGEGQVDLYVAAVAANNDGTDKGDVVYKTALSLAEAGTSGLSETHGDEATFSVYPNPVADKINISLHAKGRQIHIQLMDISGKHVRELWRWALASGERTLSLDVPAGLPSGLYLLSVNDGTTVSTKKIQLK